LNGVQVVSSNYSAGVNTVLGEILIGARADNLLFYTGSIDDIRIYNRALSASDISDLFTSETGNSETHILTFSLPSETSPATINAMSHTVNIEVAYDTDVTSMTPNVTLSAGATISPNTSTSHDFTSPVTYTVTAEDGTTTQDWVVNVTIAPFFFLGVCRTFNNSESKKMGFSEPIIGF
jgi:hypothetical protein